MKNISKNFDITREYKGLIKLGSTGWYMIIKIIIANHEFIIKRSIK